MLNRICPQVGVVGTGRESDSAGELPLENTHTRARTHARVNGPRFEPCVGQNDEVCRERKVLPGQ